MIETGLPTKSPDLCSIHVCRHCCKHVYSPQALSRLQKWILYCLRHFASDSLRRVGLQTKRKVQALSLPLAPTQVMHVIPPLLFPKLRLLGLDERDVHQISSLKFRLFVQNKVIFQRSKDLHLGNAEIAFLKVTFAPTVFEQFKKGLSWGTTNEPQKSRTSRRRSPARSLFLSLDDQPAQVAHLGTCWPNIQPFGLGKYYL